MDWDLVLVMDTKTEKEICKACQAAGGCKKGVCPLASPPEYLG